jgi:hypothetical protein
MGLALLGLALVAPSSSRAGQLRIFGEKSSEDTVATSPESEYASRPRHVCAKCAARLRQGDPAVGRDAGLVPGMPTAVPGGECMACQMPGDGSGLTGVVTPAFGPTMTAGYSASGHAVVGGPAAPMYLPPGTQVVYDPMPGGMMTGGPDAPGHAVVGGMPAPAEPAPVGIVQTGFRPPQGMPAPGATGRPGSSPYNPAVGPPNGPAFSGPNAFPGHRRPSVVAHLFGLSGRNRLSEAREAQSRSRHASISYGSGGQATSELPASMVYGR